MANLITKSDETFERAKAVIPGGISGHYGSFIRKNGPKFFSKSEGSRFWDVDGNEYIDLMCAYGPMVLGYNHPVVNEAALEQLRDGGEEVSRSRAAHAPILQLDHLDPVLRRRAP